MFASNLNPLFNQLWKSFFKSLLRLLIDSKNWTEFWRTHAHFLLNFLKKYENILYLHSLNVIDYLSKLNSLICNLSFPNFKTINHFSLDSFSSADYFSELLSELNDYTVLRSLFLNLHIPSIQVYWTLIWRIYD